MKYVSVCVLAAAMAAMTAGAHAQDEVEPAKDPSPPFGMPSASAEAPKPPRVPLFAAASAALAKRLAPEQREERRFLKDAAANTRFEFEAARLALSKSGNAEVRAFADTLITHHREAAPVLQHMLHARGMAAPMLANDQRKTLNRLAKFAGKKFDKEFVDKVGLKSQHEDVQMFERAGAATKDPVLKAWIDKTLPSVKHKLASAEQVASPGPKYARVPAFATNVMGAAPATQLAGNRARPSEPNSR